MTLRSFDRDSAADVVVVRGNDTTYAQAADAPVAVKRSGATQYLADDGQDSVTTATDATGTLACQWRFDPWGSPVNVATNTHTEQDCTNINGAALTSVSYAASRRDTASGNYQLGARTYNPTTSTFLTADTYPQGTGAQDASIGVDPLTRNTYAYVNGDPVNLTDPDGHRPICDNGECPVEVLRQFSRATARAAMRPPTTLDLLIDRLRQYAAPPAP